MKFPVFCKLRLSLPDENDDRNHENFFVEKIISILLLCITIYFVNALIANRDTRGYSDNH